MGNGDMIRRNDAINAIRTACILNHVPFKSDSPEGQRTLEAIKAVREVTAAPVREDVQGEWVLKHVGAGHYWECSVCHENPCIYVTNRTNFCPNCGARMGGEGNV